MFGKVKNFAIKKLLDKQLKNAPADQRQMILELVEKNPALFEKIAKEMQAKSNSNNQMAAAMKVLPKYQKEIMSAMSPETREKIMRMQANASGRFNPNGTIRR
jgi:predicted transcriptional regulator